MTVTFSHQVKERWHTMTMLNVTNPLPCHWSSVYPCLSRGAGAAGYETWPDIIISVGLGDWALQKSSL